MSGDTVVNTDFSYPEEKPCYLRNKRIQVEEYSDFFLVFEDKYIYAPVHLVESVRNYNLCIEWKRR